MILIITAIIIASSSSSHRHRAQSEADSWQCCIIQQSQSIAVAERLEDCIYAREHMQKKHIHILV